MAEIPDTIERQRKQAHSTETDKLGTEKISKLLAQYAIPSVIGMLAMSLYNLVDSIFIGKGVGPLALSALALAIPIMNLSSAFSLLIGVGAAAQMSIRLGRGDNQSAKLILGNMVVLSTVIGVAFTILMLVFLDEILVLLGASGQTMDYARDFLRIILWGSVVSMVFMGLNSVMRATGYPQKSMTIMLSSIVVNCILAPLFIFGFRWGVRGAAFATLTAQVIALSFEIVHYTRKKHFIHFVPGIYKLKGHIVKGILEIGLSPFILNVCASIVVIFINHALLRYGGDLHVGAYGIINRYLFVFTMTVIGINQGVQPIIGYNYGACKLDRMVRALKQAIVWATCVTAMGGFAGLLFPTHIAQMFTSDPDLIAATVEGFSYTLFLFPLVGFQILSSSFFQSIDKAQKSILLSITRQVVFLIPLLVVLPSFWGVRGVWVSMPIADFFAILLAVMLITGQLRKMGIWRKDKSPNTTHEDACPL